MPKTYSPVLALPRPGSGADLVSEGDDIIRELTDRLDAVIGPPKGTAGGDLGGNYPNPQVVTINGKAVSAVVFNTDSRLTDSRVPAGVAGGDLSGTYPSPVLATLNGRPASSVVFTDDSRLSPPPPALVASLPAAPVDGQVVYLRVPGSTGFVGDFGLPTSAGYWAWLCRYNANSPSPYKWDVLGAPAMYAGSTNLANAVTSADEFLPLPNLSNLVLPYNGDYDVEFGFRVNCTAAGSLLVGATTLAGTPQSNYLISGFQGVTGSWALHVNERMQFSTNSTNGRTAQLQYQQQEPGAFVFTGRWLRLRPIRIG